MPAVPSNKTAPDACDYGPESPWSTETAGSAWSNSAAERVDAKQRLALLARTLHRKVIPKLIDAHAPMVQAPLTAVDVDQFVKLLREARDAELSQAVLDLRHRLGSIEALFIHGFAPAARRLGVMWENDQCDFSTVTIGLGRLQRLLREWAPGFGTEVEHPPNGRRILLAQHAEEQHSFGLSMVAEFFRRDGWEVLGGVGGAVADPSAQVSQDWFDVIGFSIGSQSRVEWLRERIQQARQVSLNRSLVILVGGPLFVMAPQWAESVGADASGHEGGKAPHLAESLLSARSARR
jgi:MerR family transcriptional regulator, light-induced transcriptional regulator